MNSHPACGLSLAWTLGARVTAPLGWPDRQIAAGEGDGLIRGLPARVGQTPVRTEVWQSRVQRGKGLVLAEVTLQLLKKFTDTQKRPVIKPFSLWGG